MDDGASAARTITVQCETGETFALSEDAAKLSSVLTSLCSAGLRSPGAGSDAPLPLPLTKAQLSKVCEFMSHHAAKALPTLERPLKSADLRDLVPSWDANFVDLKLEELYPLVLAANFLHVPQLLDLTCAKVCSFLKGKSTLELRKVLGIKNDYSKEEEGAREAGGYAQGPPSPRHTPSPPPFTHSPCAEAVRESNKWGEESV